MTRGAPDRLVVQRHLAALAQAVAFLREHAAGDTLDLAADTEKRFATERALQLCTQNAIDIATHIAAGHGLDTPDYTSAIDRLAELRILPVDFARRFRGIAGLRNILVHAYLEVDLDQLQHLLRTRLGDFEEFAQYIRTALALQT